MKMTTMHETASHVCEVMKVLSTPNRLLILCTLVTGEHSVGALAACLGLREAAVSQQLAILRREGMVATRRDAQTVFYRLARDDIRLLIGFLYDTYCATSDTDAVPLDRPVGSDT